MATGNPEILSLEDRVKRLEAAKRTSSMLDWAILGFVLAFVGVRVTGVFSQTPRRVAVDVYHHHDRPTE